MNEFQRIQKSYLELIDEFFSPIYHYADNDTDHVKLTDFISRYPLVRDLLQNSVEDLGESISTFWAVEGPKIRPAINDLAGLKCLYSGDISPSNAGQLLRKSALYVDTTILPDPIHRITRQLRPIALDNQEYLNVLIRHVFNIRRVREALSADSKFPILVVAPVGLDHLPKPDGVALQERAEAKCVAYLNEIFGLNLRGINEFVDWGKAFKSGMEIAAQVKNKDLLPSDFRDEGALAEAAESFSGGKKSFGTPEFAAQTIGQDLIFYLRSYFLRVEEHKYFCGVLGAEPLYDFKRPWFFMNRDLGGPDIDTAIIQALQDKRFSWIGNAPIAAIRQLREAGELEYMRQALRNGLHGIRTKKDIELETTVAQVQKNLDECFKKHQSEVANIEKKIHEITKTDLPVTIVAAFIGWIPGIGNVLSAPFSIRDIIKQWNDRASKKTELQSKTECGINLLFQTKR